MFTLKSSRTFELQDVIDRLHDELLNLNSGSDDYAKIADQIVKLYNLKDASMRNQVVSPDTLASIAANIAGILLVLNFERAGVITSKAFGFLGKLR